MVLDARFRLEERRFNNFGQRSKKRGKHKLVWEGEAAPFRVRRQAGSRGRKKVPSRPDRHT